MRREITLEAGGSRLTPEEKKKKAQTLRSLGYDPKTKTINVNGHKARIKIDKTNKEGSYMSLDPMTSRQHRIAGAINSKLNENLSKKQKKPIFNVKDIPKKKSADGKWVIDKEKLEKQEKLYSDMRNQVNNRNRGTAFTMYDDKKKSTSSLGDSRDAAHKIRHINIDERDLMNDTSSLHELGHVVSHGKNRRYIRDPKSKESQDYEKFHKDAKKDIEKNHKKLHHHDRYTDEVFADSFVIKHSKTEDPKASFYGKLNARDRKDLISDSYDDLKIFDDNYKYWKNRIKTKGHPKAKEILKDFKKTAARNKKGMKANEREFKKSVKGHEAREQLASNALKKHGNSTALESVITLDNVIHILENI